jgi:hypothetical protein
MYIVFCYFFILAHILTIHDLNTNLNYLSKCRFTLVISAYRSFYNLRILKVGELNTKLKFERQKHNAIIVLLKTNNLSLCLNHE